MWSSTQFEFYIHVLEKYDLFKEQIIFSIFEYRHESISFRENLKWGFVNRRMYARVQFCFAFELGVVTVTHKLDARTE